MDINETRERLGRCRELLESHNIEDIKRKIEKAINANYTREKCYQDILACSVFYWSMVKEFIINEIKSNNGEIVIRNLNFLEPDCLNNLIRSDEEILEIVIQNFTKIFPSLGENSKINLIGILEKNPEGKEILYKQIESGEIENYDYDSRNIIIQSALKENKGIQIITDNFKKVFNNGMTFEMLKILIKKGIPEEKVIENKEAILKNAVKEDVILFIDWFCNKKAFQDTDISLDDFVRQLHIDIKDPINIKMIETVYKELLEKQKLSVKDIKLLGQGENCKVFKVGKFVFKLGKTRNTIQIPYHRRILQPLIRQETNPEGKNNEQNNMFIEIQEEVDKKWYKDMEEDQIEEELYKIYKEMRKDGIVWTDIKKENVGRLTRPNKPIYMEDALEGNVDDENSLKVEKKPLEFSDFATSIEDRVEEKCLQTGELVIIDTDFIFKEADNKDGIENEINKDLMAQRGLSQYAKFELRYRYEMKEKEEKGEEK